MGTSTILDIIGSTVLGGMILLIALRLNGQALETTALYQGNSNLQQQLTTLVEILEYDFRKIGYCKEPMKLPDPSKAILMADTSALRFLADLTNSGSLDTVYYYFGPPKEGVPAPPSGVILHRIVNGDPNGELHLGVSRFRFNFYDALGNAIPFPIANPSAIYSMEISIALENLNRASTEYTSATASSADSQIFWRQVRLASQNLRNR